jgi:hypothetical protein
MRVTHYQRIRFEISDRGGIDPPKANPLLKQLYEKLDGLVFKDNGATAKIEDVDELKIQQVSPNLLSCSYQILRWEIIILSDKGWTDKYNAMRNKLGNFLSKLDMNINNTHLTIVGVENPL